METPANNYAPPKSHVADVSDSTVPERASRGARLGCAMLDGLIFTVPLIPAYIKSASALIQYTQAHGGHAPTNPAIVYSTLIGGAPLWYGIGLLVSLPIWGLTMYWVHKYGQTIGKRWVGIKVVRKDGSRASLARIFWLRNFVNVLIGFIPLYIGRLYSLIDLLFIFGGERQCLHDKIADTIVVKA
jgi:uncharacterized RDD family membrane protein YckC